MSKKSNLFNILGIIFLFLYGSNEVLGSSYQNSIFKKEPSVEKSDQKIDLKSEYLLGPGDSFVVIFRGLPIFTDEYSVSREGQTYFPEIGLINVEGLTSLELKNILLEKFQNSITNPDIEVLVTKYRPVTFTLVGELQKPGLYTLNYEMDKAPQIDMKNKLMLQDAFNNYQVPFARIPKLFDAIKLGNGFTEYANLSAIKLVRKNSKSQGGGRISTELNLISLLEEGDFSQNITIHDGDTIFIRKDNKPIVNQLNAIYRSNLTPDKIKVYVNGNVFNPGDAILEKGSTLLEAIAAVGGQQNNTGKIEFIRLKAKGSSDKRVFKFDSTSKKGSSSNPILISGDIIYVRKNILGKTTSALEEISNPLFSGYGLIKLFD